MTIERIKNQRSYGRYIRQMTLPEMGKEGQDRLFGSHVLILGLGGLGSISSLYLARAGVGRLTIVDYGKVDLPDLNRQILYTQEDIQSFKIDVALERLKEANPEVTLRGVCEIIDSDNLSKLVADVDIVLDGLDNFSARMVANEVCCRKGKIFVHGGIHGMKGVVSTVVPGEGPCLKCIYESREPAKVSIPVIGPVPGIVACIQSLEAINFLIGAGISLSGRLLMFNGRSLRFFHRLIERKRECPHCGTIQIDPDF